MRGNLSRIHKAVNAAQINSKTYNCIIVLAETCCKTQECRKKYRKSYMADGLFLYTSKLCTLMRPSAVLQLFIAVIGV